MEDFISINELNEYYFKVRPIFKYQHMHYIMRIRFENGSPKILRVVAKGYQKVIYHAARPMQTLQTEVNNKSMYKIISVKTVETDTESVD